MYKLFNNRMIIYGIIDLLIQLSLRENGKEARATTDL